MGDLVDVTTVPHQDPIFYKITSGSLRFQVKTPRNAAIGLATTPRGTDPLWFVLGNFNNSFVKRGSTQIKSISTSNLLSPHEFREFWIQWHGNMICLGKDYGGPFIVHREKTIDLKYITFGSSDIEECSVLWRFELPPVLDQIRLKPVSNGIPQWLPADAQLPDGALIGGYENEILYIIRAKHQGSLTPGKFVPSHGLGYIAWGGAMHEKSELEVLCGYDCIWIPCCNGRVPAGSVLAGHSEGLDREPLYVGRAVCDDHLIPGKVQPSHETCYIAYKDREIGMSHYEILVVPHKNVQCANPFFVYNQNMKMY